MDGVLPLTKQPGIDNLYDIQPSTIQINCLRDVTMPKVTFGSALQRHVQVPALDVKGATVREALDAAFREHTRMRSYVLDDQCHLRKHMSVFIDGRAITDRKGLTDPVSETAHIYVVQALSGG